MTLKKFVISTCHVVVVCSAMFPDTAALAANNRNGFDYSDALVPADEIFWGGVRRDGIPPIHNPKFVAAGDEDFVGDKDRVLGVVATLIESNQRPIEGR